MRKETNWDGVKAITKALLMAAINETPYLLANRTAPIHFRWSGCTSDRDENERFQVLDNTLTVYHGVTS